MISRLFVLGLAASSALLGACSASSDGVPVPAGDAYTVSYRSKVRLPRDGAVLSADGYAKQLKARDPIAPVRCAAEESPPFQDLSAYLGGITWRHPVAIVKDESFPPLYDAKYKPVEYAASAGADSRDAAPTIERPDLVGVQNGVAVFLSKQHGLLAVDARSGTAVPGCAMKVPGEPKNFLFKGSELVVVVNARGGHNRSALIRYAVEGGRFRFVDAVKLDDQNILDARLFDGAIVLYTSWTKTRPQPPPPTPAPVGGSGFEGRAASMSDDASYSYGGERRGVKMVVVQWDDALAIDWSDALPDDPRKTDPFEGTTPVTTYTPGQVVGQYRTFQSFVAASDRYIVVPRNVQTSRFSHYESMTYSVCTSYNPRAEEIEVCHVNYEKRANPDYRPPSPTTGDYACNGKTLAECIKVAAPVVSQYIYVPVGQTCEKVWIGRCDRYEPQTVTYPRFETEVSTELTIYRFEKGSFTKLDGQLAKMVTKTDAIAFETGPLAISGAIANRNQIQFQNGHLYVFASDALQTLAVEGNSTSYLNKLPLAADTTNPTIAFSNDRAMISAVRPRNIDPMTQSQVEMIDLSTPSLPVKLNGFIMPGTTTQLLLAPGGLLGPGQVSFTNAQVSRTLQKLTLFSREGGQELDNLLLGTEYDTFETSWFNAADDQRIRLGSGGQRLFLPYSGRHHADRYEPLAHRLNITRVENGRLISERSFSTSDDIVRTAALDDERSLAFGDSATYLVDRAAGEWTMSTLRELFVPIATYRMNDADLHARIARVGSKCRITTHTGDAEIFGEGLASLDIPCSESTLPRGFGTSLFFSDTRTGARISEDGRAIVPLTAAEVEAIEAKLPKGYCWIEGDTTRNGAPVEFLDAVPAHISCAATLGKD
jgi:hypothetical protein